MNGFVIVDKEEGMTSFKASSALRRIFAEKKTGHTGTLDPMATGVLPVALGRATRFIELLPDSDKAYIARFRLGITSDTLDITGSILSNTKADFSLDEVQSAVACFTGDIMQTPPMYSALSVNGVRLYSLARQGIEIERESRPVSIYSSELKALETGEFELSVRCSKGTYIRSLIADIGEKLGCGAVMTALRRTASNGFSIAQAHTLSELEALGENALLPVESAFMRYPAVYVTSAQAKRFLNGGELASERVRGAAVGLMRVYSPDSVFIGLGELSAQDLSTVKVKKVMIDDAR